MWLPTHPKIVSPTEKSLLLLNNCVWFSYLLYSLVPFDSIHYIPLYHLILFIIFLCTIFYLLYSLVQFDSIYHIPLYHCTVWFYLLYSFIPLNRLIIFPCTIVLFDSIYYILLYRLILFIIFPCTIWFYLLYSLVPKTVDPRGFNKGRSSKFREGSRVRQTPEEGRRTYRPKRCGNNNKDEDSSLKTLFVKIFRIQCYLLINSVTTF